MSTEQCLLWVQAAPGGALRLTEAARLAALPPDAAQAALLSLHATNPDRFRLTFTASGSANGQMVIATGPTEAAAEAAAKERGVALPSLALLRLVDTDRRRDAASLLTDPDAATAARPDAVPASCVHGSCAVAQRTVACAPLLQRTASVQVDADEDGAVLSAPQREPSDPLSPLLASFHEVTLRRYPTINRKDFAAGSSPQEESFTQGRKRAATADVPKPASAGPALPAPTMPTLPIKSPEPPQETLMAAPKPETPKVEASKPGAEEVKTEAPKTDAPPKVVSPPAAPAPAPAPPVTKQPTLLGMFAKAAAAPTKTAPKATPAPAAAAAPQPAAGVTSVSSDDEDDLPLVERAAVAAVAAGKKKPAAKKDTSKEDKPKKERKPRAKKADNKQWVRDAAAAAKATTAAGLIDDEDEEAPPREPDAVDGADSDEDEEARYLAEQQRQLDTVTAVNDEIVLGDFFSQAPLAAPSMSLAAPPTTAVTPHRLTGTTVTGNSGSRHTQPATQQPPAPEDAAAEAAPVAVAPALPAGQQRITAFMNPAVTAVQRLYAKDYREETTVVNGAYVSRDVVVYKLKANPETVITEEEYKAKLTVAAATPIPEQEAAPVAAKPKTKRTSKKQAAMGTPSIASFFGKP